MNELTLGTVSISAILTVVLAVLYKVLPTIKDRWKPLIAIVVGTAFAIVTIPYYELAWDMKAVTDAIVAGLMIGATAVGLYEVQRTITKPRE